jgi:NAD(P)-dependent dehydrogenase (short-subunit alcohol dehydrogenase family)
MTNPARPDGPAADPRHLLVIGAGPGLGGALAHRFAQGGYHLTLLARRGLTTRARHAPPISVPAATARLAMRPPMPTTLPRRPAGKAGVSRVRPSGTTIAAPVPGLDLSNPRH